ncbi:unnamed protein product [Acanthoscelides obtectus]|uniref:MADF domain-containing protein n=1 Tax=Acanthoscelides obtectus TaxID=200917 RepID=A0A9P0Q677_ACAOB|nr:unnamed protein product [Acanthoscelides obtectus]CAK1651844.1 hypothetical protein AOBTE_LOCUS17497 [Acanthoscelides obtectus]
MIRQLIELYESHYNLWDCSSERYKNRNLRKSAMDEIASKLGVSAQDVKEKIHNLRCQFQTINRKRKNTKSGQAAGDNFEVKWEFYDALKFIDGPTNINERTILDSLTNEPPTVLRDDLDENSESSESHIQGVITEGNNSQTPSTSRSNTPLQTSHDVTPSSSRSSSVQPKLNKKKDQEQQVVLDKCINVLSHSADSFAVFGDYVADELRVMSSKAPKLQSWAKREIQRIILKMNDDYELQLQQNTVTSQQQPINKQIIINQSIEQTPLNNEIPNNDGDDLTLSQYYESCTSNYFKM